MLATGYQALAARPASFHALLTGGATAYAHVPFLVFAAPFIIVRNTVRRERFENNNPIGVAVATMIAGFWSLMSGTAVIVLLRAFELV
ncbi:hypothetical protein BVIRIDIS_10550 [Blastochloris viridis]|nr:hypothetical protein BVIRIDIS_10550 [Blastochloris viridis]